MTTMTIKIDSKITGYSVNKADADKEPAKSAEAEIANKDKVDDTTGFPSSATTCSKCSVKATVLMDGCSTCLNCGESKCG